MPTCLAPVPARPALDSQRYLSRPRARAAPFARWFYEGDDFPALQCVWPDKAHQYPWHPDASEPFRQRQPVLYDPAIWRFQEGSNRAVFTTKSVIHDGLPILFVSHDSDGDWQFLCG